MTQGTERKAQTQDSLEGANQIQPTTRRAPSISGSANSAGPVLLNSFTERTIGKLQDFSTKEVRDRIAVKRERSDMEGRVAFEQGKSFQDVEMDGDKYALQGYRVLQAQTASSSLFAQQKAAISAGGFESSPEDFRASYADALAEGIEGLDPLTASMVKENMTKQMPQLVGAHMGLHLQDQEKKAFTSLASSISVMSQDDTADADLLLNALGGPDAPSGGLSDSRRTAAVVEGITLAFQDGNPKAYAKLVKSGALDTLDSGQINKLRSVEARYQQEQAKEVNVAYIAESTDIIQRAESGDLAPSDAVNQFVTAAAKYGLDVSAQEGRAVYLSAKAAQEYSEKGDTVLIQEAALRGDHETIARITETFMVAAESGGDPNALSPKGAMGTHQVMPNTIADPGYGIKPADVTDPKDVARVGKQYWAKMIAGSAGHDSLTWEPGDVEAAAIAYNAGPQNAKKWIAAGRDYSVLPKREETEPYAKGILAKANGAGAILPQDKLKFAQELKKQTAERINLAAHEAYQLEQLDIDAAFNEGKLSDEAYVAASNASRSALKVERTKAITNHMTSTMDKLHSSTRSKIEDEKKELLDARYKELSNAYESRMAVVGQGEEYYEQVAQAHIAQVSSMYANEGFNVADMGYSGIIDHATKQLATSQDKQDAWNVDQNRIGRAMSTKTPDTLPPKLQERAFDQMTDTVGQQVADAVERGEIPQEAAADSIQSLLESNYISVGKVDPRVQAESSAALSAELIDGKGGTNIGAKKVLESYVRLKRSDPRVAATMFDTKGATKAEAVIAAAGGINGDLVQGMNRYEQSVRGVGNVDFSDPKFKRKTAKKIEKAVRGSFGFGGLVNKKDVGKFQAFFDGALTQDDTDNRTKADRKILRSDETAEQLEGYISAEVTRLANLLPGADIDFLIPQATATVAKQTEFVGGNILRMDDGFDIKSQLFGDQLSKYDKPDLVNAVIMDYLRNEATNPDNAFINKTSFAQSLNPLGNDIDTPNQVQDIDRVGVRPFITLGGGKDVAIQVRLQAGGGEAGGLSEPIWLDFPAIGKAYIERYESKFQDDAIPTE